MLPSKKTVTRRRERLFVIRLWREQGAASHTFRGSAEDVNDGRRVLFSELRQLGEFLMRALYRDRSGGL